MLFNSKLGDYANKELSFNKVIDLVPIAIGSLFLLWSFLLLVCIACLFLFRWFLVNATIKAVAIVLHRALDSSNN